MGKEYAYWLTNINRIGRIKIFRLLDYFQTEERIYQASEGELREARILAERDILEIGASKKIGNIEKEYEKLQQKGIKFTVFGDDDYPKRLSNIPDPPYCLYYMGHLPKEKEKTLAIIGARNCSEYGRYMAREFAMTFAKEGISIVSGLAKGVDGIGQKAALNAGGNSYAILGCGVDVCYPEQNRDIYDRLKEQGGIIAEYAIGTQPFPSLFPPRNRIISGLAEAVLVIEAKEKSGTFITVDMALEQGKDVYALPGRVIDSLSVGCNRLIRQGAIAAWSPEMVLQEFLQTEHFQYAHDNEENKENKENKIESALNVQETQIYRILDITPKSISQILQEMKSIESTFEVPELMNIMLSLSLKGAAVQVGQNYYTKEI